MQEKILWSFVSRNATILVEAGDDPFDGAVSEAARAIFQKSSTAGWEYHSTSQEKSKPVTSTSSLYYGRNESHGYYSNSTDDDDSSEEQDEDDAYDSDDDEDTASQCFLLRRRPCFRVPKLKAIKFHVFEQTKRDDEDEEEEDQWIVKELSCWVFAVVYNPEATTWKGRSSQNILRDVKSFVQKLVVLTELPRSYEESWRTGGQLACQGSFAATLLQRMQEVTYLGEHAQVVVDDDSIVQQEDANELMKANITAILDQQDQLQDMRDRSYKLVRTVTQLHKKTRRVVRRRLMMQRQTWNCPRNRRFNGSRRRFGPSTLGHSLVYSTRGQRGNKSKSANKPSCPISYNSHTINLTEREDRQPAHFMGRDGLISNT